MKKLIITNNIRCIHIIKITVFLLFFTVLSFFVPPKAVCESLNDRIVAVVNDEVITFCELEKIFNPYKKVILAKFNGTNGEEAIAKNRKELLDRLIAEMLMRQEAKRLAIVVKAEDVERQVQSAAASRGSNATDLEKDLAKEGISLEQYKENLSRYIEQRRLIDAEIGSRITISDEEIGGFYAENRGLYEVKESVHLQQIVLPVTAQMRGSEKEKVRKLMLAIATKLKNGEKFETLAAQYSQGTEAIDGGNIGVVGRGALLPVLEKVAFSLEVGKPSGIVESPIGFHILMVTEKFSGDKPPVQTIREDIIQRIRHNKINEKLEEYIASLRRRANVEIRL